MDIQFKKMNNSNIVVVCSTNKKDGMIHGWNLASKNLRVKTFKPKIFESGWMQNISEVVLALQEVSFYNLYEDCKYHNASVTQRRRDEVVSCLADW